MTKTLLNSMQLALRYDLSVKTLDTWKLMPGFPRDAASYTKDGLVWDAGKVDAWLRARPVNKRGSKQKWRSVVGYPTPAGCGKSGAKANSSVSLKAVRA